MLRIPRMHSDLFPAQRRDSRDRPGNQQRRCDFPAASDLQSSPPRTESSSGDIIGWRRTGVTALPTEGGRGFAVAAFYQSAAVTRRL